ncbi:uncharacterized protein [Aristolochia californica]|uniref:uncharacterized protein isoform X1 n=1 Tax=Aristolochia californica TaxID=171875 RepID=UPI0035DFA8D9
MANQFGPSSSVSENLQAPVDSRVHQTQWKRRRKQLRWALALGFSLSVPISLSKIQWGTLFHAIGAEHNSNEPLPISAARVVEGHVSYFFMLPFFCGRIMMLGRHSAMACLFHSWSFREWRLMDTLINNTDDEQRNELVSEFGLTTSHKVFTVNLINVLHGLYALITGSSNRPAMIGDSQDSHLNLSILGSAKYGDRFLDSAQQAIASGAMVYVNLDWTAAVPHPDDRVKYALLTHSNDQRGPQCDMLMPIGKHAEVCSRAQPTLGYAEHAESMLHVSTIRSALVEIAEIKSIFVQDVNPAAEPEIEFGNFFS